MAADLDGLDKVEIETTVNGRRRRCRAGRRPRTRRRPGREGGVEHHLLRIARIGPHEQHVVVAEPEMGGLDRDRHPAQQDNLVAPIELVGLARRKAQRHMGCRRGLLAFLSLSPGIGESFDLVLMSIKTTAAKAADPIRPRLRELPVVRADVRIQPKRRSASSLKDFAATVDDGVAAT